MLIKITVSESNARKAVKVLSDFGIPKEAISKELFFERDKIIRMGVPPIRIGVIAGAPGADFPECYSRREVIDVDGIPGNFISLKDQDYPSNKIRI